jgi:hypothetical protein
MYSKFVGKLRYLTDNSRPDLLGYVGILSLKHNSNNESVRASLCDDMLRYLCSDGNQQLSFRNPGRWILYGFCDASYVTSGASKSRLGGCFFIGFSTGAVHTYSKQDTTVSHSSTEAEIKAIDMAIRTIIMLRSLLSELGYPQDQPTRLYCDNKSAIEICETLRSGHKTKHINVRINYIREQLNQRTVSLHFVPTELNVADVLTKPLVEESFQYCQEKLLSGFTSSELDIIHRAHVATAYCETDKENIIIIHP